MIKKTLFVGVIASCFAFTNGNFTLKGDIDYIETVNTLQDLREWVNWDIKSGDIEPCIGVGYLENIEAALSRLEDLEMKCNQ
tara:strand:+ start:205 stop:450 length:246 start_codon:yes stop_codon:yes gene_type:complete